MLVNQKPSEGAEQPKRQRRARSASVQAPPQQTLPQEPFPDIEFDANCLTDPIWIKQKLGSLFQQVERGLIKTTDYQRLTQAILTQYEELTGEKYSEAARRTKSPIELLETDSILEKNESELAAIEAAINALEIEEKKKLRWLDVIGRTRKLHARARQSPIQMWVYVGRDQETDNIFHMAAVHRAYFDTWADTRRPHSILIAPPGHSKTTSMCGQVVWEIANDLLLRHLYLTDGDDKAKKFVAMVKTYLRSRRLRALYPHVRVLGQSDKKEDSRKRFSVERPTVSKEPTLEAAGITSKIGGNRYDRIWADDVCPPEVASQPGLREYIKFKWVHEAEKRIANPATSRIRITGSLWHQDDLINTMIAQARDKGRDDLIVAIDQFRIEDDENGMPIPIWPERYSSQWYANERQKNPSSYPRLYRLQCQSEATRIIHQVAFWPADENDPALPALAPHIRNYCVRRWAEIRNGEVWLSIDPSATSGRSSTETAATKIVLTASGHAYITEIHFMPGDPVAMQDWIVEQIIEGRVYYILCEGQGGMKGQVGLWQAYILRRLKELDFNWQGAFIQCNTRNADGQGRNMGREKRLRNTASYIQRGYIRFPGKIKVKGPLCEFVCADDANVKKLVRQHLNFPSGLLDGVDTITQFLIHNESRIQKDAVIAEPATAPPPEGRFKAEIVEALKGLREGQEEDHMEREGKWISQLLSA